MTAVLGFGAALLAMLLYGLANVVESWAARKATGPKVLLQPAYLAGLAGSGIAWLASLYALSVLPVYVVQSIVAGSLAVTVLVAAPVLGVPLKHRDVGGVACVMLGLVLVSASSGGESTVSPPPWFSAFVVSATIAVMILGAFLYKNGESLSLAVASGLSSATSALCVRACHLSTTSFMDLLPDPAFWAVLVSGGVGTVLYARALERGPVGPANAAVWVVNIIWPSLIGVMALGDAVRPGMAGAAIVGVASALAGCVLLAFSQAHTDGQKDAPTDPSDAVGAGASASGTGASAIGEGAPGGGASVDAASDAWTDGTETDDADDARRDEDALTGTPDEALASGASSDDALTDEALWDDDVRTATPYDRLSGDRDGAVDAPVLEDPPRDPSDGEDH